MWQLDCGEMTVEERLYYLRQLLGGGDGVFTHFGVSSLSHPTSEIDFPKGHVREVSSIGEVKKRLSP